MIYTKTLWEDRKTVVNATRLNNIEQGVEDASTQINSIQNNVNELNITKEEALTRLDKMENELGYVNTKTLPTGTNLNTIKTNGKYRIDNGTNTPLNDSNTYLLDVIGKDGVISQVAYLNTPTLNFTIYQRSFANNTWTEWLQFANQKDLDSLIEKINKNIEDIKGLTTRVSSNEGNISALQSDVNTIKETIGSGSGGDTIIGRISNVENEITNAKARLSTNETSITNLQKEDTAIKGRIDTLESKVTTDTETLKSELQGKIDEVATNAHSELESAKTELNGTIDGVEDKLQQDIDTKNQAVNTEITNIKGTLESLKTKDTEINEDLQAHKVDTNSHSDIRGKMGNTDNLMTVSKDLVGAINEVYQSGGSGGAIGGMLGGTGRVIRKIATTAISEIEVEEELNPNITSVYINGKRIFDEEEDYTINGSIVTLKTPLAVGDCIDIYTGEAVVIDLGKSTFIEKHERFIAEEPTNTFRINETIGKSPVEIYQEGVRLYEDYDYVLNRESRVVVLSQSLEIGEYVDYTIKMATGTDITEIYETIEEVIDQKDNIAKLPQLIEGLDNKIDKVEGKSLISDDEISRLADVNNYDDTDIKERINDLNNDVLHFSGKKNGYIDITADYDEYLSVGRYEGTFYTSNQSHAPFSVPQPSQVELIVRRMLDSVFCQEFNVFSGYGEGSSYKRFFNGTVWTPWKKIMTETDVQALIDANNA